MANFHTHIAFAGLTSSVLATTSLYAGLLEPQQTLLLWGVGMVGGILPDIDSDNSTSLRIIHSLLGIIVAACLSSYLVSQVSLAMNLAIVAGALLCQHFIALPLLRKITIHRGNCHSLLAGITFSLVTTNISIYLLNSSLQTGFLAGLFLACGFLTHLILDEAFSINFAGARLKKSFGSAIKPFATGTPLTTTLLAGGCVSQFILLPDIHSLEHIVLQLLTTSRNAMG